jgi:uncharacterized protein YqcC (DUF446 family)
MKPSLKLTLIKLADEVEAELKTLGLWNSEVTFSTSGASGAFGIGAIPFESWLQCVFLPRLREAATSGMLPKNSAVSVAAVRNLDGIEGSERLIELLSAIDRLVLEGD